MSIKGVYSGIENALAEKKEEDVCTTSDFLNIGPISHVNVALFRMVKERKLVRLTNGMFMIPRIDPESGTVFPGPEEIAHAIAKKEGISLKPTGLFGLYKLGLSKDSPEHFVYLGETPARFLKAGNSLIEFQNNKRRLRMKGAISSILFPGLEETNLRILIRRKKLIRKLLSEENQEDLLHDGL